MTPDGDPDAAEGVITGLTTWLPMALTYLHMHQVWVSVKLLLATSQGPPAGSCPARFANVHRLARRIPLVLSS